jgi:hypothetical protein
LLARSFSYASALRLLASAPLRAMLAHVGDEYTP